MYRSQYTQATCSREGIPLQASCSSTAPQDRSWRCRQIWSSAPMAQGQRSGAYCVKRCATSSGQQPTQCSFNNPPVLKDVNSVLSAEMLSAGYISQCHRMWRCFVCCSPCPCAPAFVSAPALPLSPACGMHVPCPGCDRRCFRVDLIYSPYPIRARIAPDSRDHKCSCRAASVLCRPAVTRRTGDI